MEKNYDALKLENQLCFPLYACAKEIIRRYKPFLDSLDLTYTQYIAMIVLWEDRSLNVKELGKRLFLDSGTLTPLLKKLEAKGYITRSRSAADERNLNVEITEKGMLLRDEAVRIPEKMSACVDLTAEEAGFLYRILYQILGTTEDGAM
ncbi:MAG: MarR family transcriptional regulator [Clostridia bacterium]|nr:MarR family transcriptional regulator [Clostridia bacterium]